MVTKRANKVHFRDSGIVGWLWAVTAGNGEVIAYSDGHQNKADMLHNLSLVHGRELSAGDTVINGRQHDAWRWDLDAALVGIGLKPYGNTYEVES